MQCHQETDLMVEYSDDYLADTACADLSYCLPFMLMFSDQSQQYTCQYLSIMSNIYNRMNINDLFVICGDTVLVHGYHSVRYFKQLS